VRCVLIVPILKHIRAHRARNQPSHRPQRSAAKLVAQERSSGGADQRRADAPVSFAGAARRWAAVVAGVGVGAWAAWGAVALVRGRVLLLGVAVAGVRAVVAVVGGELLVGVMAWLGLWMLVLLVLWLLVGVVLVLWMRISESSLFLLLLGRGSSGHDRSDKGILWLRWMRYLRRIAAVRLLPTVSMLRRRSTVLLVTALAVLWWGSAVTGCWSTVLLLIALLRRIPTAVIAVGHDEIVVGMKLIEI